MGVKRAPNWTLALPATPESAVSYGIDFGLVNIALDRADFDLALEMRLALIAQIMGDDEAAEAVIAAFDQAAWGAWEIGRE